MTSMWDYVKLFDTTLYEIAKFLRHLEDLPQSVSKDSPRSLQTRINLAIRKSSSYEKIGKLVGQVESEEVGVRARREDSVYEKTSFGSRVQTINLEVSGLIRTGSGTLTPYSLGGLVILDYATTNYIIASLPLPRFFSFFLPFRLYFVTFLRLDFSPLTPGANVILRVTLHKNFLSSSWLRLDKARSFNARKLTWTVTPVHGLHVRLSAPWQTTFSC